MYSTFYPDSALGALSRLCCRLPLFEVLGHHPRHRVALRLLFELAADPVAFGPLEEGFHARLALGERPVVEIGGVVDVARGAGGVELLLSLQTRLTQEVSAAGFDATGLEFTLVTASAELLPAFPPRAQLRRALGCARDPPARARRDDRLAGQSAAPRLPRAASGDALRQAPD